MDTFFQEIISRLEKLHDEIREAVNGLPQEALDWVPGSEMNSIGILLAHVAGSEKYWLGEVIAGSGSERDRAAEFETIGVPVDKLLTRLDDSLQYCREVLANFGIDDLHATRISPRDGRQVTLGWSLAHGLEHIAQHCGHIQVTRQFWALQTNR
ncbi:MAG: DinB family protein [Anaerolineales bacterium]|nr:MAG: DinB family protein [Anaerolineales bacterium]